MKCDSVEEYTPLAVTGTEPISTPPDVQRSVDVAAIGPQRWNDSVASNVSIPVTVTVAESETATFASAGSPGIAVGVEMFGVVTVVDVQRMPADYLRELVAWSYQHALGKLSRKRRAQLLER